MWEDTSQGLGRTHRRLLGVLSRILSRFGAYIVPRSRYHKAQLAGPARSGLHFGPPATDAVAGRKPPRNFQGGSESLGTRCGGQQCGSAKVRSSNIKCMLERFGVPMQFVRQGDLAKCPSQGKGSPGTCRLPSSRAPCASPQTIMNTGDATPQVESLQQHETRPVIPSFRPQEAVGSSGALSA